MTASKKQALALAENNELRQHIYGQDRSLEEHRRKVEALQAGVGKRDKDMQLMRYAC